MCFMSSQMLFPEEIPGLPPWREIECEIELIPYAQPVFKALFKWP